MIINLICYLFYIIVLMCSQPAYMTEPENGKSIEIHLTISAKTRSLEVSWENARLWPDDIILITTTEPKQFRKLNDSILDKENLWQQIVDRSKRISNRVTHAIGLGQFFDDTKSIRRAYECNNGSGTIRAAIVPKKTSQWLKTLIDYDIRLSNVRDATTKCYGYWASYIDRNGEILATNCLSAHPTWMNDMRHIIGDKSIKDLFIPGTHNSGSYKPGFDPIKSLDLFTRYALTQDEDVWEQLMHGIRYLDIRVGHYHWKADKFYTNHDISRQRPLVEVLEHVREFVRLTNEIVIVDVQEFPVGFHNNQSVHEELLQLIQTSLGGYMVRPGPNSWNMNLNEIWGKNQNIIVAYDFQPALSAHSNILFHACIHRWASAKDFDELRNYMIKEYNYFVDRFFQLPTVDMAELTADVMGILTGRFPGLRSMADSVNSRVSKMYRDELGEKANIVAVDFYRGTRIVDLAIEFNIKRHKSD